MLEDSLWTGYCSCHLPEIDGKLTLHTNITHTFQNNISIFFILLMSVFWFTDLLLMSVFCSCTNLPFPSSNYWVTGQVMEIEQHAIVWCLHDAYTYRNTHNRKDILLCPFSFVLSAPLILTFPISNCSVTANIDWATCHSLRCVYIWGCIAVLCSFIYMCCVLFTSV